MVFDACRERTCSVVGRWIGYDGHAPGGDRDRVYMPSGPAMGVVT